MIDSVEKYGSGGVLFDGHTAEIKSAEQQIQELQQYLEPVVHAFEALMHEIKQSVSAIVDLWDSILKAYPDKRVVWLAFHHKKERIRKKNRNRIIKFFKRRCDNG